jgi:mRNA interferase MazF
MSSPRRGEVWWVDLEPTRGAELNKRRPAVVVQGDEFGALAVKLVAPLTKVTPAKVGKVWLIPVAATATNGLTSDSVVDVLQMRGVSLDRFSKRIGLLEDDDLGEVAAAIAAVVGFE